MPWSSSLARTRERRVWTTLRMALLAIASVLALSSRAAEVPSGRALLVQAILADDAAQQVELVKKLVDANDPVVAQALTLRISDGEVLKDSSGQPLLANASELTPADVNSKLRKAIKATLDLFALGSPNPKMRRDAVTKLGQEQNADYLPFFETRLKNEREKEVIKALHEAIGTTQLASEDEPTRIAAVEKLGELRSLTGLALLEKLRDDMKASPGKYGDKTATALRKSIFNIEDHIRWGNFFGTAFRGFSTAAVLLVAALGLAITFGLMGVINMAHGEIIMVGAYSAYVTQNVFTKWFGVSGGGFDCYFIAALAVAFAAASCVGLILERGVIRFLYQRPLESLLATWGVSLVLQQIFRHVFGAANVQVSSPSWLSGSFVVNDVGLGYNRLFVIGFALFVVLLTYVLLTRTSLGLQIRAVMQNRGMAAALGVRTDRVNMMTFAYGSGLAGMAGACLSQIGNVSPALGQYHIVDCFMIVVLGGVGSLVGTVSASMGVGLTNQILEPWLGSVLAKITVLVAIILFLQWRPVVRHAQQELGGMMRNTKHQTPNTGESANSRSQSEFGRVPSAFVGVWNLEVIWGLGFEVWCFSR